MVENLLLAAAFDNAILLGYAFVSSRRLIRLRIYQSHHRRYVGRYLSNRTSINTSSFIQPSPKVWRH